MRNKVYVIISIALLFLVVGTTLALTVFRSESIGVNILSATNLGEYINYSSSNDSIGGGSTLNPGSDYTSGLSTTIEFWKKEEARNFLMYGHIYLDINSGSDELLSSPALKWAVVSNGVLISEGDFVNYFAGDEIPVLINHKLSDVLTNYTVYVWIDENESMNNLTEGDVFSVSARSEVTLEEYVKFGEYEFDYTGNIQTINLTKGTYMLEVWGAQGGYAYSSSYRGGYGGYSKGNITLTEEKTLYVVVGGQGGNGTSKVSTLNHGGYNGGGDTIGSTTRYTGSGGGATHIALVTGELNSFADTLDENLNNILIVAGGGGAAGYYSSSTNNKGGNAGGFIGNSGTNTGNTTYPYGEGGTQSAGGTGYIDGSFGQGADAVASTTIGGGGGFYGGGAGQNGNSSGGGSGYIGNELLTNKVMYCYECMEDSNENTYTVSILEANDKPISNKTKKGNGYAVIKDIGRTIEMLSRKSINYGTDYDFKVNVLSNLPEGYSVSYSTYDNASTLSVGEYQIRYIVEDAIGNVFKYCQKIEVISV